MRLKTSVILSAFCLLCANWGLCDDARPVAGKSISMEVLIAQVTASGTPGADVPSPTREQILELEKKGQVTSMTRVQLTTLDEQSAMIQFGERAGAVTGRTAVPGGSSSGGRFATNVQIQDLGTLVEATPRVEDDGSILLMLKIEQSRLVSQPAQAGEDKNDPSPFMPPKTSTTHCKTTLRVPVGKWVATGGQRGEKEPNHTWIFVSAKLVDAK